MMTDSIKFGPEWLRNMSQGISKPQLAEHRYGREEMLALFDISSCNSAPDTLKELSMVYSEKPQTPLSLQQMSEDETRLWNRGINSDTVVRASVRTTSGRGTTNIEVVRGGSTSARGRGGRGSYYYNSTRPGFEESPESGGSPMNRDRGPHRPFERLNSNERNMNRNGEYSNDWRGRDESNWWRKNRGGVNQSQSEESSGRWGRTRTDSYNNDRWPAGRPTSRYDEDEGWDRGETRWSNNSSTHERRKLDWGETLPEWAVDNPGEKGGSFDSSGAFHDNHYDDEHHYNMRDEQSRVKEEEYEENNDDVSSVTNIESSNTTPSKDKQINGQEKEETVSSSISTSPSQNEETISSPERFKSMRQQHQHKINSKTTKDVFIHNDHVINNLEPVRLQKVPDVPVIHSKSSPAIPLMSDCQPNKIENIKSMREMSSVSNQIDNSSINTIHRSTSLNANANHRIDSMDAEAESMVSRLTSDNFKIGPSSHTPLTPLNNNKWYYRDPQGEVQGPFLTTEMAEWYSLGYFHDNMLMVKRTCDEHFYSLGDLVRLKGNVPFSDIPFTEQDVKMSARISVQPPPTHNPFSMNESLVLQQQQQQQQHYQYRQLYIKQREIAIQNAVHQLSQSERWNNLAPLEQQQLIMHHVRNVEVAANTAIPPMYTAPILPQPQPQPPLHPMNPPSNNNLMVMLSHMQQQQQQQQHFNHQIDSKHNIHAVPPSQPMTQQLDPLHSLVQSMGGLKTSTPPPVNAPLLHQNSNIIRPNSVQSENNPISDLLRQLGAPQDKPLKVAETSVWGVDFTGPDIKPKINGPIGMSGWQSGPSIETSQQPPSVIWASGEYTKLIGADHQAIEEAIKEEARRGEEARKQEIIKQNEQIRKREEEKKIKLQKDFDRAKAEEEMKKEEVRRNKEQEKKIKEEAEKKKLEKKKLEEENAKKREHEKKLKEEKERRLLEEKKKEEDKRLQEEEKKKKVELKKKEDQKKKDEQKKKEESKRKEEAKKQEQKKKDEDQKKKQDNSKSSAVPIVTEPQKKKKKEPQTVPHNGVVESASAPWAAADQKKQMQVKSMAEIQAEEQKREQMLKQKERERAEREMSMVAIEQAKQDKARNAVKTQSWSTVIAKSVPPSTLASNNSVWGSTNQMNSDKTQAQKSTKTPTVSVNNKNNVKNVAKTISHTIQQTNAMKKVIESRGENNNCNDEFSQWCCKHLASLNKNTIDIPTFVTFLKDVESEFEVKDYIQNYLGDNKEVREFIKQFFDKRLKIQNKQRSSDFVEMKSKNKKRNKMVPLDNKVLGFNVVASERINVGELDLGE